MTQKSNPSILVNNISLNNLIEVPVSLPPLPGIEDINNNSENYSNSVHKEPLIIGGPKTVYFNSEVDDNELSGNNIDDSINEDIINIQN